MEREFILAELARETKINSAPGYLLQLSKQVPTRVAASWWAWECFWAPPPLLLAFTLSRVSLASRSFQLAPLN